MSEKPTPESRRSLLLLPPPFVVVNVAVGRPLAASLDSTSSRNCHSTSSSRPGLADVLSSLCVDRCSVTRQTQTNNRKRFLISYPRRQQWRGHNVRLCLCLLFHTMSQKPMQLGSRNLTKTWSTISPKSPLILWSTGQRSRSRGTKTLLAWIVLNSSGLWSHIVARHQNSLSAYSPLIRLHWLPLRKTTVFNIAWLTYRILATHQLTCFLKQFASISAYSYSAFSQQLL